MTQTARVKNLLPHASAEVTVQRKSACGHDCSHCSGCELTITGDLTVKADNKLGSRPGDLVLVESENKQILGAAAVMYLVPFLLFFAAYGLCRHLQLGEKVSVLVSFLGLLLGLLPARWLDRRYKTKETVRFRIVRILESCSAI